MNVQKKIGERGLEWLVYACIFFLPWQTVWIIQEKMIGAPGTDFEGLWQYGASRIYAIEFLMMAMIGFFLLRCAAIVRGQGVQEALSQFSKSPLFVFDTLGLSFLFLAGCSIFWSPDKTVAAFAFMRLGEAAGLYGALRVVPLRLSAAVGIWIAAGVIQAILACFQFVAQDIPANTLFGISAHDPKVAGDSVIEAVDRRLLRGYGAFPHPTILGAYLSLSFFLCCIAIRQIKQQWQWCLLVGSASIISAGLFVSFARGAWLALFMGLIGYMVCSWVQRERSKAQCVHREITVPPIAVMLLCSAIVFGFLSYFFHDEMAVRLGLVRSRLEVQSVEDRVDTFNRALPMVWETWYRGVGIGSFTNALFLFEKNHGIDRAWYTYQPIHNVLFMVFVELGIGGLLLFLTLMALVVKYCFRSPPAIGVMILLGTMSVVDHFFWALPVGIFMGAAIVGAINRNRSHDA